MRGYLLVVAATAVVALTGSTAAVGAPIRMTGQGGRTRAGAQLWVEHLKGGEHIVTVTSAMAVSPRGNLVFLTGESFFGRASGAGYATVAYNAATGKQLWASRYLGPGTNADAPTAMAVSPDAATVFVTGFSPGGETQDDYATVAYSAATGKQLWVSRYNDPGNGFDTPDAMAVSQDGAAVFVTGASDRRRTSDYATIAYNTATGKQLWISRYHIPGGRRCGAGSVAVSPDGNAVFVTGSSDDQAATVAYSAASGKQLWVSRYHVPKFGFEWTEPTLVSDGTTVFVTGTSHTQKASDTATVAYKAATGKRLWVRRYRNSASDVFFDSSLAVSPGGTTVIMARTTSGSKNGDDFTTVAYRAATGRQLWIRPAHGSETNSVAVNPHGAVVYVTGVGYTNAGFTTVAYNAATGRQLWLGRYHNHVNEDQATLVLPSPSGTAVFVTGVSVTADGGYQYTTVAYRS